MYFFPFIAQGTRQISISIFSHLAVSITPINSDVVLFLGQNICYNIAYLEKKNNPISGLIYEKKLT